MEKLKNPNVFDQIADYWKNTAKKPKEIFTPSGFLYCAGGAVAASNIMDELISLAGSTPVSIATVPFTGTDLETITAFYRSVTTPKKCMDERLAGDDENASSGVHKHCGFAAAAGAVVGKNGAYVEDEVIQQNNEPGKAGLLSELTEHHNSLTVYIDLTSAGHTIVPEKKQEVNAQNALPFIVSFPLDKIEQFCKSRQMTQEQIEAFMTSLLTFNLGIAQVIINDEAHNQLAPVAQKKGVIAVVDKRGVNEKSFYMTEWERVWYSYMDNRVFSDRYHILPITIK